MYYWSIMKRCVSVWQFCIYRALPKPCLHIAYRAFDQSLYSKMEQSWYLMLPVIIARGEKERLA